MSFFRYKLKKYPSNINQDVPGYIAVTESDGLLRFANVDILFKIAKSLSELMP